MGAVSRKVDQFYDLLLTLSNDVYAVVVASSGDILHAGHPTSIRSAGIFFSDIPSLRVPSLKDGEGTFHRFCHIKPVVHPKTRCDK